MSSVVTPVKLESSTIEKSWMENLISSGRAYKTPPVSVVEPRKANRFLFFLPSTNPDELELLLVLLLPLKQMSLCARFFVYCANEVTATISPPEFFFSKEPNVRFLVVVASDSLKANVAAQTAWRM